MKTPPSDLLFSVSALHTWARRGGLRQHYMTPGTFLGPFWDLPGDRRTDGRTAGGLERRCGGPAVQAIDRDDSAASELEPPTSGAAPTRSGPAQRGLAGLCSARLGSARPSSARPGPSRPNATRSVLARLGFVLDGSVLNEFSADTDQDLC